MRRPAIATHTIRLQVRHREVDVQGHVNNTVYLEYVDEAAVRHAEAVGMGLEAMRALGGMWVVRRHTITYHRPALSGDAVDVTTTVAAMGRVRAQRHTTIVHSVTRRLLAECDTEWVWVGLDGRPKSIPPELLALFTPPAG